MTTLSVVFIAILSVAAGCAPRQVAQDHILMRDALLETYEKETLDNLARRKLHYPVLVMGYGNAWSTVTNVTKLVAQAGTSNVENHWHMVPVSITNAFRTIGYTLGLSAEQDLSDQMLLIGGIVRLVRNEHPGEKNTTQDKADNWDLDDAFTRFSANEDWLRNTEKPPKKCECVIWCKFDKPPARSEGEACDSCRKPYFWVPNTEPAMSEFTDLVQKVMAAQGRSPSKSFLDDLQTGALRTYLNSLRSPSVN